MYSALIINQKTKQVWGNDREFETKKLANEWVSSQLGKPGREREDLIINVGTLDKFADRKESFDNANKYLNETNIHVIRFAEQGKAVPQDISDKRRKMWALVDEFNATIDNHHGEEVEDTQEVNNGRISEDY